MSPAYQLTPSMILYAAVFSVTLALSVYAVIRYLRHDRRPVIIAFVVLMAGISSWELANFLVDAVTTEELKLLGKNVVNAVSLPVFMYALVAFSLTYTDNERWIGWAAVACAVHIAGMSAALFIAPELLYESHGLTTQGPFTVAGFTFGPFVVLDRTLKPAFMFYWAYVFLVGLTAGGILVRYLFEARRKLVLAQISALLIGIGAPLSASVLLVTGVFSPAWNPTDMSFIITAITFGAAIFRYRLFRLVPVGRQQLVRMMNDPIVLLDDDDRVVDSNPTVRDLFGVGSYWRGTAATTFFGPFAQQVTQSHSTDDPDTEIRIERDGDDHYFNLKTTPVRTPAGEVGGRLVVFRDITKLIESRQEIQQQNEQLDKFASVVAHDLRNPLSVASGFVKIAEETGDLQHVERINSAHGHMERLINDLLTLARGETTISDTEQVDLRTVTAEAWEYVDTAEATLTVADAVPTVAGDGSRLIQLFGNLFKNAIDHGGHDVTVTVGQLKDGDGFYVEDDGDGIPPEKSNKVFEHGVTSSDSGTGFGLSIVAGIAEAHGWSVRVTDGPDGGARFEFSMAE